MWIKYTKKPVEIDMRPYVPGEDMIGISVSEVDKPASVGGMIARNPDNHKDRWYVAKKYFNDNYHIKIEIVTEGA